MGELSLHQGLGLPTFSCARHTNGVQGPEGVGTSCVTYSNAKLLSSFSSIFCGKQPRKCTLPNDVLHYVAWPHQNDLPKYFNLIFK